MKSLNRNEILQLVERICDADFKTEEEYNQAILLFVDSVPDPEAADLIFHHNPELTPEEIVDKALSYKPIITAPPK